jgi:disulfide bond formation protein DsbB
MRNPDPAAFAGASPTLTGAPFPLLRLAVLTLVIASATILGAIAFERIGGYLPCPLCLMQRTPYYVGIPVLIAVIIAIRLNAPRFALVALFAIFAALMLYNAGLGAYHSGVEWGVFEGPESCATVTGPAASLDDVLARVQGTVPPSCTEATWRFVGLSFAGWNALISALLAVLGLTGAGMAWQRG